MTPYFGVLCRICFYTILSINFSLFDNLRKVILIKNKFYGNLEKVLMLKLLITFSSFELLTPYVNIKCKFEN